MFHLQNQHDWRHPLERGLMILCACMFTAAVFALATGNISTVAGIGVLGFSGDGGQATTAQLNDPRRVMVDGSRNLYIADMKNCRVRKVDASTGVITTVAGNGTKGYGGDGGPATAAMLNDPKGMALDAAGNLYIADSKNHRVRRVDVSTGIITTIAGTGTMGCGGDGGPATSALLNDPHDSAVDASGNVLFVDMKNCAIRKIDPSTGVITTVAGTCGVLGYSGDGGSATSALLRDPKGFCLDSAGNIYIADSKNHRVRKVYAATGIIVTIAGTGALGFSGDGGAATLAKLNDPHDVTIDSLGNIFIADKKNRVIRKIDASTGVISTVAGTGFVGFSGDGGPATSAMLKDPGGVAVDSAGDLYIADSKNHRIRMVDIGDIASVTVTSWQEIEP